MKTRNITLAAALTAALIAGTAGAYAYYSAQTATISNSYNIVAGGGASGDSAGTIDEVFNPDKAKDLGPRASFDKDVKVTSKLDYSSYVYLLVTVPTINARLKGESAKSIRESVTLNFDNTGWTLVKHTDGSAATAAKYLYRYSKILAAKGTTPSLFTRVTVPDYIEAESLSATIDVTGYMISSEGMTTADSDKDAIANFFS